MSTPDTTTLLAQLRAVLELTHTEIQVAETRIVGDLALEHQLLDRARYIKALAVAAGESDIENLAFRLIAAHSATVDWLTTVLAEDALGGPAALRRTPLQAAAGAAVRLVNVPVTWSARGLDRALDTVRTTPP